ncbi:MAG: transcriptional regulator [Clostridium sp. 27_14]|nr:MAG: transcriptional regulator [Clostridium sp. 27_14]
MLFISISFLYYFLPIVIILYFIVPKKFKNFILFLSSIFFYFCGEPIYTFLMIGEIFIAYVGARYLEKYRKKSILVSLLAIHIGALGLFKYSDFTINNINQIFGSKIPLLKLALPIGISFYTFQIISYVVDVYRGKVKAQKSFLKLATYVSLFPQLIAGPIVRYETIEKELDSRTSNFENFAYGVRRFVIGLGKKVLIANMLGELCDVFSTTNEKSILFYWIFAISYSLQIYFDFSAYSDMAIGLGRMFGFHFLENFNYPYISKSITEFWRRWHMSLSSWFRDYVYIPLGGNRKETIILVRNIFIVWALTGIWHGANWTFVIWGLMFGIMLIIEKLFLTKHLEKMPSILQRIYVLFTVMISFIIFNANSIGEAWNNIIGLFGANGESLINASTVYYLKSYLVVLVIAIIGSTPLLKNIIEKLKTKTNANKIINLLEPIAMASILIIVTAYLVDNSYNPFLYFRF